jgi:hypothetical protein
VYGLFRRWQRTGAWAQILTALQARADAAGLITWDVSVDFTIARAHQHAAGARKRGDLQAEPPVKSRPIMGWAAITGTPCRHEIRPALTARQPRNAS